jgi:Complex 1 protein (LYR family)
VREGIIQEVRVGFRTNKNLSDNGTISASIKEAQRSLAAIKAMSSTSVDSDSWVNNSDEDDKRGRIGQGWPWDSKGP